MTDSDGNEHPPRLVSSTGPDPLPVQSRSDADDPDDPDDPDDADLVDGNLLDRDLLDGDGMDLLDGDDGDLLDDVIEFVVADEPHADLDFLLVPLLTEAERQMRSIRRPLDAEMCASELLGMLEQGAPDDSTLAEREADTLNLATRLAQHAMDQDSPSGLAMLRTLSVIGPPQSRALAQDAAARMVEAGFRDRAWAPALGRPDLGRSWRFRDPEGTQESVTVVFRYGTREHTLTALIDHELGGGVKDCWIGEDPDGVLAETRQVLAAEGIEVEFVPIEQARATLRSALAQPECPTTPDEIEDVAMCRALLRSRVALLVNGPTDGGASTPGTLVG